MINKQLITFEGMAYVKDQYTTSKLSDTEFAAQMTSALARLYSTAHVRQYRASLGIANNKQNPTIEDLINARKLLVDVLEWDNEPGEDKLPASLAGAIHDFLGN